MLSTWRSLHACKPRVIPSAPAPSLCQRQLLDSHVNSVGADSQHISRSTHPQGRLSTATGRLACMHFPSRVVDKTALCSSLGSMPSRPSPDSPHASTSPSIVAASEWNSPHATLAIGLPRSPLTSIGVGQNGHHFFVCVVISAPSVSTSGAGP